MLLHCNRCESDKEDSGFYRRSGGKIMKPCMTCTREKSAKASLLKKGKPRNLSAATKLKSAARCKAWREANPDRQRENDRKWRLANPERCKEIAKKWRQEKPMTRNLIRTLRRKRFRAATPPDADKELISLFYFEAMSLTAMRGERYEVDHIKPLARGGLHHQCNLQVLVKTENCRKGAKLVGDGAT